MKHRVVTPGMIVLLAAMTVTIAAGAIPVASFTVSERTGLAPFAVQFTDTSTNSPTSWLWEFGDGGTSTQKNPSHTYSSVGAYTVNLTASNGSGSNKTSKYNYVATVTQTAFTNYRFFNIYVANDEGVKYDVPNGAAASGGIYEYVPNTYWVMFRQAGGGLNPIHISATSNAMTGADITRTAKQSGSFWITFSGGQNTMHEAILMLAVNGSIPDDFKVHIQSSGQEFYIGTPMIENLYQNTFPDTITFLQGDAAVNQTFDKSDFIYGPQSWKPCSSSGYPIYGGEDQANPINQFQIMFIDLRVGAVKDVNLPNKGMIKVDYEFTNLSSTAIFNIYGWYMRSNHGTGIIMTNDVDLSGFAVTGASAPPVANFVANTTTPVKNTPVQFTDTSTNVPMTWSWSFGDGGTSTDQYPVHTYTTPGTYSVTLTVTNPKGSDTETKLHYMTVTIGVKIIEGQTNLPTDPDKDGKYEDLTGNGEAGFADVVLFFKKIEWISDNEPVSAFDFSGNGEIGFQDIVLLFKEV